MSKLNIILMIVFAFIAVLAVLVFAGILPGFGGASKNEVALTMWSTYDSGTIAPTIALVNNNNKGIFKINYVQKNSETYEDDIINALASGEGPDIFTFPHNFILKHKDKAFVIPYQYLSRGDFRNIFIEEAELFLSEEGIIAFPFSIDPIVMYYNRDLLSGAGIPKVPKYWDEFIVDAPKLNKYDDAGNIVMSVTALGEFVNIGNAKEILSLLILQTGNKIIDPLTLKVVFNERGSASINPAENALRFYTEFSDPAKSIYSWSRGMSSDFDRFISGRLAFYFAPTSEYQNIKEGNPHLNFDVNPVPQIRPSGDTNGFVATFGSIEALFISRGSVDTNATLSALFALSSKDVIKNFSQNSSLPPVRRDVIGEVSDDARMTVFENAAIISRGWLEPDPVKVSEIFKEMIESASSGRLRINESVRQAERRLQNLLQ